MTDTEQSKIIGDMVLVCDNREQKNQHILKWLNDNNIPYKIDKLETADYTFYLPNYPELDMDNKFLVERKGSLNEIVGNLTKDRPRFMREFERVRQDQQIHIVAEGASWKKIMNGTYRSDFSPASFMASLLTINMRYSCPIWFCTPEESGALIYNILKYELREQLKNMD